MRIYLRRPSLLLIISLGLFFSLVNVVSAQNNAANGPSYVYIAIDPEIVTNYAGDNSKKLGYLLLSIEIMLDSPTFIENIEHHMPLLRATAIEVVGGQSDQQVRSLTGREEMRREILKRFRDTLTKETGNEVIKDIIFTKYLRQGG
jgi:flagellar FliL protein